MSEDPIPGGREPNEIHPHSPREGAYSKGVAEYTVSHHTILFRRPANERSGCLTEGFEGKDIEDKSVFTGCSKKVSREPKKEKRGTTSYIRSKMPRARGGTREAKKRRAAAPADRSGKGTTPVASEPIRGALQGSTRRRENATEESRTALWGYRGPAPGLQSAKQPGH